jgi:hypothetical protein
MPLVRDINVSFGNMQGAIYGFNQSPILKAVAYGPVSYALCSVLKEILAIVYPIPL